MTTKQFWRKKKHSPLLTTSISLWHKVRDRKLILHSPCLLFSKLYCQPKVLCKGLLYFNFWTYFHTSGTALHSPTQHDPGVLRFF